MSKFVPLDRVEDDAAIGPSLSGYGIAVNYAGHSVAIISNTIEGVMAAASQFIEQRCMSPDNPDYITWDREKIIRVSLFKREEPTPKVDDDPCGIGDPFA